MIWGESVYACTLHTLCCMRRKVLYESLYLNYFQYGEKKKGRNEL